jgi:sterol desaturase/sphingolipid hydroxylase (fatty acid hydroxylase superfamily)
MLDWLLAKLQTLLISPLAPLYAFARDGDSRFYWVYCLTGIAMAAYVYHKREPGTPFRDMLFDPEVWGSRSARNDYWILVISAALKLTVLSWAFLNWRAIAAWVADALRALGVEGTVTDGSALGVGLALTLTLFLVDDFLRWWLHYLMHKVPELWEFHKVHHSAEVLNFTTSERIHPVEIILSSAVIAIAVGVVNGLFIALFGDQLTLVTVFGANAFLVAFNLAGGVLRHSPFWVSFGPAVERWVISPAMHQIHHSDNPAHFDKNMGGSLAIWDRMFGTIHIPDGREVERFGIGAETSEFRSLATIYFKPIVASIELARRRLAGSGSRIGGTGQPGDAQA